jgi:hypothetical protein
MITSASSIRVPAVSLGRTGLLTSAVAAGANALVYFAARAGGVSLIFPMQPGASPSRLPIVMVVLVSAAAALSGSITLALMLRFFARGTRLFPIVGGVVLLLSLGLPLSLTATDGATKATLVFMHIVAGVSIIGLLSGTVGRSPS